MTRCHVYRSSRRADTYVYLPRQDDFAGLPKGLMRMLGKRLWGERERERVGEGRGSKNGEQV